MYQCFEIDSSFDGSSAIYLLNRDMYELVAIVDGELCDKANHSWRSTATKEDVLSWRKHGCRLKKVDFHKAVMM